jgi:thioredoxin-related protein
MKKIITFLIIVNCFTLQSQNQKDLLKTYTFEEVELLHKQNPKPILVYIYTDWCKFCFAMEKNTFKNKKVIQTINDQFYFIKLNAETKKDITFLNKKFIYKATGINTGIHELTNELASVKNRISYPTITKLNSNFEIEFQKVGYLNSNYFIQILK